MDTNANSYSNRGNARRAAEAMINNGTAPAVDYGIKPRDDGRFEIVWKTGDKAVTTDEVETEVAEAAAAADQWFPGTEGTHFAGHALEAREPAAPEPAPAPTPGANGGEFAGPASDPAESEEAATAAPAPPEEQADPFPAGSSVQLRSRMVGQVSHRIDERNWAVTVILGTAQLIRPGERARRVSPPNGSPRQPRRSKAVEANEAAARGVMPTKPDVTSHANHHYQKRFDKLAELAAAGDWDAVAGYECNGINSYAKMVRQYRDRLVAAHKAQEVSIEQGAAS